VVRGHGYPAAALAGTAVLIASCTSPTSGVAVKAAEPGDADAAVIALMDTGPYATAQGHPFGAVGDDAQGQSVLEAHRIADYTVGPWEADDAIRQFPAVIDTAITGPVATPQMMRANAVLPDPLPDVAAAHRMVSGFSTVRTSGPEDGQPRALQNVVLLFPDPGAAAAAAAEMAAKAPDLPGVAPGRPTPLPGTPEALAETYDLPDGIARVDSFTARGPYVLYQSGRTAAGFLGKDAAVLVDLTLTTQKKRIDEFSPTERSALPDLPLDPTGLLMAQTLWAPDNSAPFIAGMWQPRGWLHFEVDPVTATALFNTAGVDAVGQRLTTVYQAANADGAARIVDEFSDQLAALESVKPVDGVPGLPGARCFERERAALPSTAPATWQRVAWHFKCVARADRWAYTAYSADPADARQQVSAQYRILAGE